MSKLTLTQRIRPACERGLSLCLVVLLTCAGFSARTVVAAATAAQEAATPHWIWYPTSGQPDEETRFFRKAFAVKQPSRLSLDITADNRFVLFLDGEEIAQGDNWQLVQTVTVPLTTGSHVLAVVADPGLAENLAAEWTRTSSS